MRYRFCDGCRRRVAAVEEGALTIVRDAGSVVPLDLDVCGTCSGAVVAAVMAALKPTRSAAARRSISDRATSLTFPGMAKRNA